MTPFPAALADRLKRWGTEIHPGQRLNAIPRSFRKHEEVLAWWRERLAAKASGWAQFSSENVMVRDGEAVKAVVPVDALLLCAEVYEGNGSARVSHHLRRTGNGWVATEISRAGDDGAVIEIVRLAGESPARTLVYEVCWEGTPLRPSLFRLVNIGFERTDTP